MVFRSRGRQGLSRMSAAPRQTSRIKSRSTVSKYGGRSSTPTTRTSTTRSLRTRSARTIPTSSKYVRGMKGSQTYYVNKGGNVSHVSENEDGYSKHTPSKSGHLQKSKWVNKITSKINPGTTVEGVTIKTKTGRKMSQGITQPVPSKKHKYTSDNTYKTLRTGGGSKKTTSVSKVVYKKSKTNIGAKIKAKKLSRAKITGKKVGAKAGKLSVKGVRMGPKGTRKPQTTTRGGPRGTSTTTRTGGGRVRGGRGRDTNAPYRRDNPRKSLSDEYADLGRIY